MIPAADITKWGVDHRWPTRNQVEQDLLLSQTICEIANDDLLGKELVIRGGTAYHKLFLPRPLRYSEDLDYVRTTEGGIGPIMKKLTSLGEELGYRVNTKMGAFPKVFWKTESDTGSSLKIKIEISTYERSPALPLIEKRHEVETNWYVKEASVQTFQVEELVATKLRALYQRSKGRDLFDLWLALEVLNLDPIRIVEAFAPYRPANTTADQMVSNLEKKVNDVEFQQDLNNLVVNNDLNYDPKTAGEQVIKSIYHNL